MALYEASPMTQRSASTRLDLPQPFGPTTPVSPCSIWKSVGSTNDLNPSRRSLLSFIIPPPHCYRRYHATLVPLRRFSRGANRAGFLVGGENESVNPLPQQR